LLREQVVPGYSPLGFAVENPEPHCQQRNKCKGGHLYRGRSPQKPQESKSGEDCTENSRALSPGLIFRMRFCEIVWHEGPPDEDVEHGEYMKPIPGSTDSNILSHTRRPCGLHRRQGGDIFALQIHRDPYKGSAGRGKETIRCD
jgi:hypothetical protein